MTAIATNQESASAATSLPARDSIATSPVSTSPVSTSPVSTSTLSNRFLLVQIQSLTLVIPALWVEEIFRVERLKILALPFYSPLLIGITHHGGRVLPLLSTHKLLNVPSTNLRENTMVVKLGNAAGALAQVGLVIDRPLGSQTRDAIPSAVFESSPQPTHESMVLLRSELVSTDLWQPLSWVPSIQ